MNPLRSPGHLLLLAACSAGLGCATVFGSSLTPVAGAQAIPLLAQAPGAQKASPYAKAQDAAAPSAPTGATGALDMLKGTKAVGSEKDSPFAGAKESDTASSAHLRVNRSRLWWLLLPVGLAAVSYAALRTQDSDHG